MKYLSARALVPALFFVFLLAACTRPDPLGGDEIADRAQRFWEDAQPAERPEPLGLGAALRRGLEHNLEYRVQRLQVALAAEDHNLARSEMLPSLTAEAGYSKRDRLLASSSESVDTGQESLVSSTSRELSIHDRRFELGWNFLDVALHYSRSRQKANEQYVAGEEYRRLAQVLIREIVHAWSQVAAWAELRPEIKEARAMVRDALARYESMARRHLRDPVEAIDRRKALIEALQRLDELEMTMREARAELMELVAWPPGAELEVDASELFSLYHDPRLAAIPEEVMQRAALELRPEVRQAIYGERIAEQRGKRRLIELFPSLITRYGIHHDSNRFLLHNDWHQASASMAIDLMKLSTYPARRRSADLEKEQAEARYAMQAVSVLSQVMMSRQAYLSASRHWCYAREIAELDARRLSLLEVRSRSAGLNRLAYIDAWVDNLTLRVRTAGIRADRDYSLLTLLTSTGLDIVDDEESLQNIDERFHEVLENGIERVIEAHDGEVQPIMKRMEDGQWRTPVGVGNHEEVLLCP